MIDTNSLKELAEREMVRRKKELDNFAERFAKEPLEALRWADAAYEAAAGFHVAEGVLEMLKRPEHIAARIGSLVRHGARYPERSSSPSGNLAKTMVVSAWAEWLERVEEVEEEGSLR